MIKMYDDFVDWKRAFKIRSLQISAGSFHILVLDSKEQVWSTGHNGYGQLGLENFDSYNTLQKMDIPKKCGTISTISAGGRHTIVLNDKGQVWDTGYNEEGQLGLGNYNDYYNILQQMIISEYCGDIVAISAGSNYTIVLDNKGQVWSTGDNRNGQLGLRDNINRNTLTFIVNLLKI